MKFQPPKGTRDFLPEEMAKRRKVFEKIRKVFEGYGYGEVWTPAFEDFELLSKKSGPDIENEIYVFTDKAGRKLGLRFDPTVSICRIVASDTSLPKPIKFCYITNMWRYDQPGKGRWREFWQAGVELIGSNKPEADAEILSVVYDVLKSVGIKKFYFKINSRKIVESLIKQSGIPESKKFDVFRVIDKLGKIGEKGVRSELGKYKIASNSIDKFLELVKSGKPDEVKDLKGIKSLAEKMGVENIKIDFSIVRGIDYYTGFVFETFVEGEEDFGSVASGGRYDTLVGLYGGQDLPATGFGIGVDRLMEVVVDAEKYCPVDVYVAIVDDSVKDKAFEIVQSLRRNSIRADINIMDRKLSNQLEYANSLEIPFVVIVGKKELGRNLVKVKDMIKGKESEVKLHELVSFLNKT
ncbi:MAG: histidine--tRNA ligase [Candidatus Aenigmarchaeota archaeon]|nr:histidine--tRNA ligase [Candidatus Aenigmarchaeota archaeon]